MDTCDPAEQGGHSDHGGYVPEAGTSHLKGSCAVLTVAHKRKRVKGQKAGQVQWTKLPRTRETRSSQAATNQAEDKSENKQQPQGAEAVHGQDLESERVPQTS